jgi:hypothetical protein
MEIIYKLYSFCGVWVYIGSSKTKKGINEIKKEFNIDGRRDLYKIIKGC